MEMPEAVYLSPMPFACRWLPDKNSAVAGSLNAPLHEAK